MDFTQFNIEARDLGYNLDTYTIMDAYAEYEITNKTIEACIEAILTEEEDHSLNN